MIITWTTKLPLTWAAPSSQNRLNRIEALRNHASMLRFIAFEEKHHYRNNIMRIETTLRSFLLPNCGHCLLSVRMWLFDQES